MRRPSAKRHIGPLTSASVCHCWLVQPCSSVGRHTSRETASGNCRGVWVVALTCAVVLCLLLAAAPAFAQHETQSIGAGSIAIALPHGAKTPPETIYKTDAVQGPIPTNDWWSSLVWMPFSERQYPHPLAVRQTANGLQVYYPGTSITANKSAIFGFMPDPRGGDFILGHSAVEKFPDARLDGFSDWFVRAAFAEGSKKMTVDYGHGSPYVYAHFVGGSPTITFARTPKIWAGNADSAVLGVSIGEKHYALFGAEPARRGPGWTATSSRITPPARRTSRWPCCRTRRPRRWRCFASMPMRSSRARCFPAVTMPPRARSAPRSALKRSRWKAKLPRRCSRCTRISGNTSPKRRPA